MIAELQKTVSDLQEQLAESRSSAAIVEQTVATVKLDNQPNPFSHQTEVIYD